MAPRGRSNASRGSAVSRHAKTRVDRDGDLNMVASTKSRGGISKRGSKNASTRGATNKSTRFSEGRGRSTVDLLKPEAQRQLLNKGRGDVNLRDAKPTTSRQAVELKVGGWTKARTSDSADRGASALKTFLEKKASIKLGSKHNPIRIKQSRVEGDDLIIQVRGDEAARFLRLDGYVFAGVNITVSRIGDDLGVAGSQKEEATMVLKNFLDMRYNPDLKLLDLSAIGSNPLLQANFAHLNEKSTAWKLFAALMTVLGNNFENEKDKEEAIVSVTLAQNDLPDLSLVNTLTSTLPNIRNLDLSLNKIESTSEITRWKNRLPQLDQLVVTGNPLETKEPNYQTALIAAFKKMRLLNNIQVRTDAELANETKAPQIPFPYQSAPPVFQDEGQIVETFIRDFFQGFDTDRNALVAIYYDAQSKFSFHVNTSAPRDPATSAEKPDWTPYLSASRNLRKITQLPPRVNREFVGQESIARTFAKFPMSKHPQLDGKSWMIESHLIPGVPDRSGRSNVPVDGFMITVHGQFEEAPQAKAPAINGTHSTIKSFDRTFVLSPGGSKGVVVVSDIMSIRSYGGTQAFEPEAAPTSVPALPNGLTPAQAQELCQQLQSQTGLTEAAVIDCLNQTNWDLATALARFNEVKSQLPPTAFIIPQS